MPGPPAADVDQQVMPSSKAKIIYNFLIPWILFSAMLFTVKFPWTLELSIAVFLVRLLPAWRRFMVGLMTIYAWIFLEIPFLNHNLTSSITSKILHETSKFNFILLKIGSLALVCGFLFLYEKMSRRIIKNLFFRIYVFLAIVLFAHILLYFYGISDRLDVLFIWLSVIALSHFMWYFCFVLYSGPFIQFSFRNILLYIMPFWCFSPIPISSALHIDRAETAYSKSQWAGVRLLCILTISVVGYFVLNSFLAGESLISFFNQDLRTANINSFTEKDLVRASSWGFAALGTLCIGLFHIVFRVAYFLVISASSGQMIGYTLRSPFQNIFKSKTFNDFFRRFLNAYSNLIITFFYYPMAKSFRFIRNEKLRYVLADVLAICLMGVIYHFCSYAHLIYFFGRERFFLAQRNLFYYSFLVAILSGCSLFVTILTPGFAKTRNRIWFTTLYGSICFSALLLLSICFLPRAGLLFC